MKDIKLSKDVHETIESLIEKGIDPTATIKFELRAAEEKLLAQKLLETAVEQGATVDLLFDAIERVKSRCRRFLHESLVSEVFDKLGKM